MFSMYRQIKGVAQALRDGDPGQRLVADLPLNATRALVMSSRGSTIINRLQQRTYQTARQPRYPRLAQS
ncbi:hypothetical protein M0D69_30535 [Caballeronia sp. SEWSISQ10-4 2]|uniref:hypothetical protein n=1 Tax=Caballeronia sp. SEWSISQ10-4 2 TaxID=2937438 RepID=UPI002651D470|nr:hypothetical protein [Caballeronia sp. SEWSISQ10-4 2]MDN7182277.1 hypothetical protein [Caballeronia sp. SEWSISQ10-4 2]